MRGADTKLGKRVEAIMEIMRRPDSDLSIAVLIAELMDKEASELSAKLEDAVTRANKADEALRKLCHVIVQEARLAGAWR